MEPGAGATWSRGRFALWAIVIALNCAGLLSLPTYPFVGLIYGPADELKNPTGGDS